MDKADLIVETDAQASGTEGASMENSKPAKKKFVTPEISAPVDVLEATTFFQAATSGATN